MALVQNPICEFGWKARDFSLTATDGRTYALNDVRGKNGTLVVFIDEVHTIVGAGAGGEGAMDAGNILKPRLARGEASRRIALA